MSTVGEIIEGKVFEKVKGKKGEFSGIVVLDIAGPDGGQWSINCDDATIEKKDTENPRLRIRISDEDFKGMMNGELDPMRATFSGRLKIEGDMAMATKLAMAIK